MLGVELTGGDVEVFAGEQQAAEAELAISLGVDHGADAAKHGLGAQADDVGRVALAAGVHIHRRIEAVAGLGEKVDDPRRSFLVFEEVWTNYKEYFAELTEAYFGKNDFFPFERADLKKYDPTGYKLMQDVWGQPRDGAAPSRKR
jgi:hypothetical protein